MKSTLIQPFSYCLFWKSPRNNIHIYCLAIPLRKFKFINQRMSKVSTSFIRFHEYSFKV